LHNDEATYDKWIAIKTLLMSSRYRDLSILRALSSQTTQWRHLLDGVATIAKSEA
jgi:hypothetical protein